jgi:flagellin-specific chaperone FliS
MAQILSSNMQQIYAYIPQNPDVEFLQKNQQKVAEIRKSLKLLEQVEEKCR